MPFNQYLGWSRNELETLRRSIQEALATGRPTKVTILGVTTENDPYNRISLDERLKSVQYSISQLSDADPDDPKDANPFTDRPGITQQSFV